MKYIYYVSYAHENNYGNGFGSYQVCIDEQITSMFNVNKIIDFILENNEQYTNVVILNFILLRTEE